MLRAFHTPCFTAPVALILSAAATLCFAKSAAADAAPPIMDDGLSLGCGGCGKALAFMDAERDGHEDYREIDQLGLQAMRDAAPDTDVLHYDLDIEVVLGSEEIYGSNVITVKSLIDGLAEFTFRLSDTFTITSATLNGVTPVTVADISFTTRQAILARAYNVGEVFSLEIVYNGVADSAGIGSIRFGSNRVSTLSEPYYAYTWWPCKDGDVGEPGDNADKATVDIAITAPDQLRTVSNGLLMGMDALPDSRARYRWSSGYPIATYLVAFSSAVYNTWTVDYEYDGGVMPVEFNIFPGSDSPAHRTAWERCIAMMAAFAPLFGEYPFIDEKYGIYEMVLSGGMEHQTNTGQGLFWTWLTAHELGHQWWGDAITCRTWHDIWLNEGFATYSEALWKEFEPGSDGEPALHAYMSNLSPGMGGGSVYRYDISSFGDIFSHAYTYHKGAWVLHQLRHVVGSDTFFDILREYRATYEGGAATTDDFAAVASTVYGQDLTWFFDEWVYGIGTPDYEFGWQTVNIRGRNYLRLYVNQFQPNDYGVFTMPIDVRVDFDNSAETYVVFNDYAAEHFVLAIPDAAAAVTLDEDEWILRWALNQVDYVAGPPVVVRATPAPGEIAPPSAAPSQLEVTFSDDVIISADDVTVERVGVGPLPFSLDYSPADYTATLAFGDMLPRGEYVVTVRESVRVDEVGLDGDVANPLDPTSLPSGEGLAGGNAVFKFLVRCNGDLDGDEDVDLSDLARLLANHGTMAGASYEDGDLDGDGDVDLSDLASLLANYGGAC